MSTITTRIGKGSALTWEEADANFTNLNIDKVENTTLSAEDGSQLVGFIQTGTGAVPTNTQTKLREVFSVADFGVIGDGSNETTTLQNALNAAEGSILLMDGELVYGYTSLTIKQNTTVIANGSVFNRVTASTSPGIVIESGVNIDSLVITTPVSYTHLKPEKLVIPYQLQFEAKRILNADGRVGTDLNDPNVLKQSSIFNQVIVNHYLNSTGNDDWFILTNVKDGLKYFERRGDQFEMDNDFDTENAKFKATARYSFGWSDPRAIYGSQGA